MKRMIITGAAGSIGAEIVRYFYKKYDLICIDINIKKLKVLKVRYKNINIYQCDLTNQKKISLLKERDTEEINFSH